jgi:hypothetical protein
MYPQASILLPSFPSASTLYHPLHIDIDQIFGTTYGSRLMADALFMTVPALHLHVHTGRFGFFLFFCSVVLLALHAARGPGSIRLSASSFPTGFAGEFYPQRLV